MKSLNKVFLIGNLGADAEEKIINNSISRITLSMCTNRSVKRVEVWEDEPTWHTVIVWRQAHLLPYLKKGKGIHVEGRIESRSYTDENGIQKSLTDIVAENVILL